MQSIKVKTGAIETLSHGMRWACYYELITEGTTLIIKYSGVSNQGTAYIEEVARQEYKNEGLLVRTMNRMADAAYIAAWLDRRSRTGR